MDKLQIDKDEILEHLNTVVGIQRQYELFSFLLFTLTISGHRAAALLLHDDVHVERWAGGGGGQGGSRGSEDAR